MTPAPGLTILSQAGKDALIVALFRQLAAAEARISELTRPPNIPDNLPKPPCAREVGARIGSEPRRAVDDRHGSRG